VSICLRAVLCVLYCWFHLSTVWCVCVCVCVCYVGSRSYVVCWWLASSWVMAVPDSSSQRRRRDADRRSETRSSSSWTWFVCLNAACFCLVSLSLCQSTSHKLCHRHTMCQWHTLHRLRYSSCALLGSWTCKHKFTRNKLTVFMTSRELSDYVVERKVGVVLKSTVLLFLCVVVTTCVGKPSAICLPTRPTQPFIPSGSINE